jgi:tetratricopeptide (TPR) repeat protein
MPGMKCTSEANLRAFLLGELPERVARSIASHLEVCPDCEAVARRLDRLTDPVIDRLREVFDPAAETGTMTTLDGRDPIAPQRRSTVATPLRVEAYEILEELGRGGSSAAEALADDLHRVVRGEPIRARCASLAGVARRWCRRNPAVTALLLAFGLLLTCGALGATFAALRFQRLAHSESLAHQQADRMVEAERIARARADRHAAEAQAVVELRSQHLGPEHPLTIDSTLLVAMSLHNAGAYGAALGPAEKVYNARLRILGADHVETADALFWVASSINHDRFRREEARSMFVRVIDVYRRKLPPDDPKLTDAMGGLAWTLGSQKRYAESLAAHEETLRIIRRYRGPENIAVAHTLHGMAEVLAWSGRREEAAAAYEEALRIISREQDPGYIRVYTIMDGLLDLRRAQAAREHAQGRPGDAARLIQAKALPICDQRVTRAEAWLARDPRDRDARRNLVVSLAERGAFLAELGRRAEALKDVDRGLAVGEEVLFPPETTQRRTVERRRDLDR